MSKFDLRFKGITDIEDIKDLEKSPFEYRKLPKTIFEGIEASIEEFPDSTAISFFLQGKNYKKHFDFTYTDLHDQVFKCANALNKLGVKKNDVVAICLPNLPEAIWAILAAQCTGIAMPINPLLEAKQLKYLLEASNAKVLITIGPFLKTDCWEKLNSVRTDLPNLKAILQVSMANYLSPFKKNLVKLILRRRDHGSSTKNQKIIDFSRFINTFSGKQLNSKRVIQPIDTATFFHTGGTTGMPKLAEHSHENTVYDIWAAGTFINTIDEREFTMFSALPLFHVFGAISSVLMPLSIGGKVIIASPKGFRDPDVQSNFWEMQQYFETNYFAGVPAIFQQILANTKKKYKLPKLRLAITGAAPMPKEVFKRFEEVAGVSIMEGYGCTECTCIVSANPPYGERKIGSVGLPIPYEEVCIANLDDKNIIVSVCETNQIGSILVRGKNVFQGYLNEEHNKKCWVKSNDKQNAKPWFNTGDLGRIDEDGYVWITGRKKELIIRGGHNIDPKSIEEPFYDLNEIELVAAVGRPDSRVGEVPVLYVQFKDGKSLSKEELMSFAEKNILEKAALPKFIYIKDQIPLTTIDKIFKPKLIAEQTIEVYVSELNKINDLPILKFDSRIDPKLGLVIEIKSSTELNQSIKAEIKESLASYSIPFELSN